jgi:hypothetical protein
MIIGDYFGAISLSIEKFVFFYIEKSANLFSVWRNIFLYRETFLQGNSEG